MPPTQQNFPSLSFRPYSLGPSDMTVVDGLKLAAECGFENVELTAFTSHDLHTDAVRSDGFFFDQIAGAERDRTKEALQPFQRVSLHAPCEDLLFFSENRRIRELSRGQVYTAIEAAAFFEAEVVTIHPHRKTGMIEEEAMPLMIECCNAFGEAAAAKGTRIALENTRFPFKVPQLLSLTRGVANEHVGVAFNVAKAWHLTPRDGDARQQLNDTITHLLTELTDKVQHLYLCDTAGGEHADYVNPGEGLVDFDGLFSTLRGIGYGGLMVLQMAPVAGESRQECTGRVKDARRFVEGKITA